MHLEANNREIPESLRFQVFCPSLHPEVTEETPISSLFVVT